jgi:hypothetical protein
LKGKSDGHVNWNWYFVFSGVWRAGLGYCPVVGLVLLALFTEGGLVMFESFGDFFWTFMAMSGFMFWICFAGFVALVIRRNRLKKGLYYEQR